MATIHRNTKIRQRQIIDAAQKLIAKYGFNIKDLELYETSLEEAFIDLVRKENSK